MKRAEERDRGPERGRGEDAELLESGGERRSGAEYSPAPVRQEI